MAAPEILVIDDDAVDRLAIRRHLSPSFSVREAETGIQAIELLQQCPPCKPFACVLLDCSLPDIDGISLLKRFYDVDNDMLPFPFVMMTGHSADGVMAEALRCGVHDLLFKDNITQDNLKVALQKAREIFDLRKARHSMEEKLRHAQKMDAVGQLTSGIAHDFNNLLTVVLGNTHILKRRMDKLADREAAEGLAKKVIEIELAAKKGADLVRHMMVFTRQSELKRDIIDAGTAVGSAVTMLQRTLGERVEVRHENKASEALVCVDATLLESAIINIAVNARDAMPKGGKLAISTSETGHNGGRYFMISMADNGTGMPEHVRQRIFEPFYTTKRAGEGTGLGLAMVYGFISQSGGHIEVDSEEGRGTEFRIYLPLHAKEEMAHAG